MMIDISSRHVILSGCSGGGKSTLLSQLATLGFHTVSEAGRRIVAEQMRSEGKALPWVDLAAFAERAIEIAAEDRIFAPSTEEWVFFDRGLVDAAVALEHATGTLAQVTLASFAPYHCRVFLTPPWHEIYVTDHERRQNMSQAIAEYDRLLTAYDRLGYETIILPKIPAAERARFVLRELSRPVSASRTEQNIR